MMYIDCEDKVVLLKVPTVIDDRKYNAIKAISEYMKDNCGAREVVTIPAYTNLEVSDIDKGIDTINKIIDILNASKSKLENMRDNK